MATRPATTPKGPGSRLRKADDPKGKKAAANNPRRLSPDELDVLKKMAIAQLPMRDMAMLLGVHETTLERMAADDPLVADAMHKGRADGMRMAHQWAFKKAFSGNGNVDMAKFWLRCKGGWKPEAIDVNLGSGGSDGAPVRVEFALKGGMGLGDALDRFIDKPQVVADPIDEEASA
jgi:predicted DNA-binding protein (UPF0251 family)